MASAQAIVRLQKEYKKLLRDPVPHVTAHPSPRDLLRWHYVLQGPAETDYAGGLYHGTITFPPEYPWKPPAICMLTPNGRFQQNVNICLSMTSYHAETWNPLWGLGSILQGLLSFMLEDAIGAGGMVMTPSQRRQLASQSLGYNRRDANFCKLFPELLEDEQGPQGQQHAEEQRPQRQSAASAPVSSLHAP